MKMIESEFLLTNICYLQNYVSSQYEVNSNDKKITEKGNKGISSESASRK